jgi:ribosomal subunit interface protein
MKVIVKARHMNLTPALKAHAEDKLGKAIMRVFDRPAAKIEIELSDIGHVRDKSDKECRVTVFMPKGKTIVICEVDDEMYKAIDLAHDRLLEQVKRERGRKLTGARNRKEAESQRARTARETLSTANGGGTVEPWEQEVKRYESSLGGA